MRLMKLEGKKVFMLGSFFALATLLFYIQRSQPRGNELEQITSNVHKRLINYASFLTRRNSRQQSVDPWANIPNFAIYVRFASFNPRWPKEFEDVFLRSMRLFFPMDRAKLLVVLDDERKEDHQLGEKLKTIWPKPDVCFLEPGDPSMYKNNGKGRMFLDMLYPDNCTDIEYVGYVDTDTFFDTLVTPQLLFDTEDNNKPIIVAKIGETFIDCWLEASFLFLRKKEVLQCMSTFPVMIKTEHMRQMRKEVSKLHGGKPFDEIFRDSAKSASCICQFSFMCNYLWYYHRDEYSWRMQMVPNGDWRINKKDKIREQQVDREYYYDSNKVKPAWMVPIPRSSMHLRHGFDQNGKAFTGYPPSSVIEEIIKEGLCYSAGFKYCPEKCTRFNETSLQKGLFLFEWSAWFWDKRCMTEQKKHYANVQKHVEHNVNNNRDVFGVKSVTEMCQNLL